MLHQPTEGEKMMESKNDLNDGTTSSSPKSMSLNPTSLYILVSFVAVVTVWFCRYVRMRRQRQIDAFAQNRAMAWNRLLHRARVRIQNRTIALANQRVRDRRQLILDNVIHKKVISGEKIGRGSSGNNNRGEITLLPHKECVLQNSLHTVSSIELDEEEQGATITATASATTTNTMIDPDPEFRGCLYVEPEHENLNSFYDEDAEEPRLLSSWRSKSTTRTCTSDTNDEQEGSTNIQTSGKESHARKFSPLHPTIVCPICIDPFQPGDEVCWSKSERCNHVYHLDCMTEWLMENEECPLCRENYLCNNEDDGKIGHDEDTVHR